MSIKEQINSDFLTSYKAHEELRVSVLRMLKSSIQNAEISLRQSSGSATKKEELNDSDIIAVMKKEIKQRQDSIAAYNDAGRADSAAKEQSEMEIISAYLPKQLSEEEIRKVASDSIEKLGATGMQDMGKIIGAIMQEHGDNVNGGTVSGMVKELLSK